VKVNRIGLKLVLIVIGVALILSSVYKMKKYNAFVGKAQTRKNLGFFIGKIKLNHI